jgi:hypothetical protein
MAKSVKSIRAEFYSQRARKKSKSNQIVILCSEPLKIDALIEKFKKKEKQNEKVQEV